MILFPLLLILLALYVGAFALVSALTLPVTIAIGHRWPSTQATAPRRIALLVSVFLAVGVSLLVLTGARE